MNAEVANFDPWEEDIGNLAAAVLSPQVDSLKKLFTEIHVLAEQDSTSGFFSGVLNPSICLKPNFDPTSFEFQTEFDRRIKSRVCFREFVDQFGVKHLRIGDQVEHELHEDLVTSSVKFLKCWYEMAFEMLSPTHVTSTEVREILPNLAQQLHSLSPSSPSNSYDKSIPLKFCNFIGKLRPYEQMSENCLAIHALIVSLCQDVQDCEFSLQIEDFFKNKAPEYRHLLKTATEEMRLYKEFNSDSVKSAWESIDSLDRALHDLNEFRKQGPGFTEEWFQDTKSWKRFCFLKGILAKMQLLASKLSSVFHSNVQYVMSQILAPEDQASQILGPENEPSREIILFSQQLFNLVCIFFSVIVEVNTNWPNSRNFRDVESWKSIEQNIKMHADYRTGVLHSLTCAANEAAAVWLQSEMSGFCYDVCQYNVAKRDQCHQASHTKLNRVENLAVDMHPDCEDIIGMRVWFIDHVSTGGFNQRLEQSGSVCGVLIVHVYLRYDLAISRPGKTQSKFYSRSSCACGNVQLPSWIEDACVRLFYQPLLDYLIHDYFEYKLANPKREPVRLVFTGSAFDAVLATVIASELVSALVSYRKEHEVHSQHSPGEWDSLFNHIRSSVFVLSFMLPAVFSKHHFLPILSRTNSLGGSIIAPHEHLGINMLNITFHSCVCSQLVEVWLSIDRDVIAESENASLWKETSQFDLQVLLLLEKLTSSGRKFEHFDSSINESLSKIHAKAKTLLRDQKAKLQTFVADYKHPKTNLLKSGKIPFRFLDSLGKKQKSVFDKFEKVSQRRDFVSHGHKREDFWPGMLTFVQDFKLLNCNMKFPHGHFEDGYSLEETHRKMDMIVSWFLPIAAVYEIGPRNISPSQPPVGRQSGSYGVVPRDSKQSHEMSSRMSVKPLRSSTDSAKCPDRLLVQWCCDSIDSQVITCNCFAVRCLKFLFHIFSHNAQVTITACFDPQRNGAFIFQSQQFTGSNLKVNVAEGNTSSVFSLQCEVEFPVPDEFCQSLFSRMTPENPIDDEIINSTIFIAGLRMRFFSGLFGICEKYQHLHHGFGPELFLFPKRNDLRLNTPADDFENKSFSSEDQVKKVLQSLNSGNPRRAVGGGVDSYIYFRKALLLDEDGVYSKHIGYNPSRLCRAHDIAFCDFEKLVAGEKSYNSRYRSMRIDELIMQAWDFKLLALNAFGNAADLIKCNFVQCDAILQFFDVHSDHLTKKFRVGSLWDENLSSMCESCASKSNGSRRVLRSHCADHVFDYLNDDLEGLDYVRKQSSYLRRVSFSKKTFLQLQNLFVTEKRERKTHPTDSFFGSFATILQRQDVTDRHSSVADRHPLMWKLVSSRSEGNFNQTMMSKCDYAGLRDACFEPSSNHGHEPPEKFDPRFPINMYENERYELDENQSSRMYPVTADGNAACSLSSRPSLNNAHHFRSIFGVVECVHHSSSSEMLSRDIRTRIEAEYLSCNLASFILDLVLMSSDLFPGGHGMGALRSFAIRREFEYFCNFFSIAKENKPFFKLFSEDMELSDPYMDSLRAIRSLFETSESSAKNRFLQGGDDYFANEWCLIELICAQLNCSPVVFQKEIMHSKGQKAFRVRLSTLNKVKSLERKSTFFFREDNFWPNWITSFVCFVSHIHQLRNWLVYHKRCIAAFGDQKVGKSRFWMNSLGIDTQSSSQSNTVQTQMWILPSSQFIDFPAFSDENKLGASYNTSTFVRCDILARHLVYDFLLVPDICVFIVKTASPNTESIFKLIGQIHDLETHRYPSDAPFDEMNIPTHDDCTAQLPRTKSAVSAPIRTTSASNRMQRESVLLCSHTQNFICRLEAVHSGEIEKLGIDPKLLSLHLDRDSMRPIEMEKLGPIKILQQSRFVWVCGHGDDSQKGHCVKILEKDEQGRWKVPGWTVSDAGKEKMLQPSSVNAGVSFEAGESLGGLTVSDSFITPQVLWNLLRQKLMKKKIEIGEVFSTKNVYLAYFAEYNTTFHSPYDEEVQNHIETDFPWASAFCTPEDECGIVPSPAPAVSSPDAAHLDLPILDASRCLALIIKKSFTSFQRGGVPLDSIIEQILVRPISVIDQVKPLNATKCSTCTSSYEDPKDFEDATFKCQDCNVVFCDDHKKDHQKRNKGHSIEVFVDEQATAQVIRSMAIQKEARDEEDSLHQNSDTNRKKREKVWSKATKTEFKGNEVSVDRLCGCVCPEHPISASRSYADPYFPCGNVKCLLQCLEHFGRALQVTECQDVSQNVTITGDVGMVLWSCVMGDQYLAKSSFNIDLMRFRAFSPLDFAFDEAHSSKLITSLTTFIQHSDNLWELVKKDVGSVKSSIENEAEKIQTSIRRSAVFHGAAVSSSADQVVPWFSAKLYNFLKDGTVFDEGPNGDLAFVSDNLALRTQYPELAFVKLNLIAVLGISPSTDKKKLDRDRCQKLACLSQKFCLALLKIILLPLFASKKCRDPAVLEKLRLELQYSNEFVLKESFVQEAMYSCMQQHPLDATETTLQSLLKFSSVDNYRDISLSTLRLLFRNISLKGMLELQCLDLHPYIPTSACNQFSIVLRECLSVFAIESPLNSASSKDSMKEQEMISFRKKVQSAFDKVECWALRPLREIEGKFVFEKKGKDSLFCQEVFQEVFILSHRIYGQFMSMKQLMSNLIDGSYALVNITLSDRLRTSLISCEHTSLRFLDIPLKGRFLMRCALNEDVDCFLCQPNFGLMKCKLVSDDQMNHLLRLEFQELRKLGVIDLINATDGKGITFFSLIICNCSTFFSENSSPFSDETLLETKDVVWYDLLLLETQCHSYVIPQPIHNCSVTLSSLPSEISDGGTALQLVGKQVLMNISFCCRSIVPVHQSCPSSLYFHIELDPNFEYEGLLSTYGSKADSKIYVSKISPHGVATEKALLSCIYKESSPSSGSGKPSSKRLKFSIPVIQNEIITVSFSVRNPDSERLCSGACFIFTSREDCNSFNLDVSPHSGSSRSLHCGIARTPRIYNNEQMCCELLLSTSLLGANEAQLLLTFECSVDLLVFDPTIQCDNFAIIEIELPKAWSMHKFCAKDGQNKPVVTLNDNPDVSYSCSRFCAECLDVSNSKMCIKIEASPDNQGAAMFLKEGNQLSIIIHGIVLPNPAVIKHVEDAEAFLATYDGSDDANFEMTKKRLDEGSAQLEAEKEMLTSGCIVSIRAAGPNHKLVMRKHNVPMSPLHSKKEFLTVIQRATFEASNYEKIRQSASTEQLHEGLVYNEVEKFVKAYVDLMCKGDVDKIAANNDAVKLYSRQISFALAQKRRELHEKEINERKSKKTPNSPMSSLIVSLEEQEKEAQAMTIQLWTSSKETLCLENEDPVHFFQMLNRYTLASDSEKLLKNGGMLLIKAMTRSIVISHRALVGSTLPSTEYSTTATSSPSRAVVRSLEESRSHLIDFYWRGGSVPFEMAGFFFPGTVFRFPAFIAVSSDKNVALRNFAAQVKNDAERTLWKIRVPAKCMHFKSLQENSLMEDEQESLFPPYSAFKVVSNRVIVQKMHYGKDLRLRLIRLDALTDNQSHEAKNVPTAPRY